MLYKKYHRNHIKQFRIGVKFRFRSSTGVSIKTITTGPIIDLTFFGAKPYVTIGIFKHTRVPLIFWNGQLVYYSIIENLKYAVQEIS